MLRRFLTWWWRELAALAPRPRLVRVPAHLALQRTLELPLAAERNLRAALAFEMDRYIPFKADEVYYAFEVTGRDPAKRTLRVLLTAVPCSAVDPSLEAVEALGVRLARHGAREGRGARRAAFLAAALLAALGAAAAAPLLEKRDQAAALGERLRDVRRQAAAAEAAERELAALAAEARVLPERRRRRAPAIDVLRELTTIVPEHSWLAHVELAGGRVRLRGASRNAADVVTAIEGSALFSEATFEGSVTRDPGADHERFALSAAVAGAP